MHARNAESHSSQQQPRSIEEWSQSLLSHLPSPLRYACVAFGLLTVGEQPTHGSGAEGSPRWSISFIDSENCSVRDLQTGETYTAEAAIIKGQFGTPESNAMVRFEGGYPAEWSSIISQTQSPSAWPITPGAEAAQAEELRMPTQQDARAHAELLRNAALNQGLTLRSNDAGGSEWEVTGVRFVFRRDDLSACVVHAPGVRPYRITGLGSAQQATERAPIAAEQSAGTVPEAVRRSLYQALSDYCKEHPLTADNRTRDGIWNVLVPVNGEHILFTLSNPNQKEWEVSGPGFAPFALQGIPYSVAARIFNEEGKHELARQFAEKAGISLSPSQMPSQSITHTTDGSALPRHVNVPPPAKESQEVTSPEESINTSEYFRLLSDHCKRYALSSGNLVSGTYHIEVESNQGTVLFDLKDREAKLWRVQSPGMEPFWMTGIPNSVAAHIFKLEGNLALANTLASKAGMSFGDQERVVPDRLVATVRPKKETGATPRTPTIKVEEEVCIVKDGKVRISESYNLATFHADIDAETLNRVLKGVLKGKGQKFIDEAKKNGLCPLAFAAISLHESENGCSDMAKDDRHNVFGIYDQANEKFRTFDSVDHCIVYSAKILGGVGYLKEPKIPRQTIARIQEKYCPIGADNDPKRLNKHWRAGVTDWMRIVNGGEEVLIASAQKLLRDVASN